MRKTLASLLSASILTFAAAAHAQQAPGAFIAASSVDDAGPQNTLTTNPVWLLFGGANLAYERAIGRHASVMVAGVYWDGHGTDDDGTMNTISLTDVTIQPHFYFGKRALEGFYMAPFVELSLVSAQRPDASATEVGGEIGATIGWSWLVGPANIKLGAGGAIATASARAIDTDGNVATASGSGAGLAVDLTAGWAF